MITVPHTHTRQHPYCNTSIHSINSIPHNNQQTQSARDLLSQQPRSVETTSNANINLDAINTLTNGTLPNTTSMQSDSWGNLAQYQPDRLGRLSHQRESSLSSMGSTGPASPYNSNTSNPQIAITDSAGDDMSEMHAQDASNQNGSYYQMAKSVGNPYSAYQNMDQSIPEMAYPVTIPGPSSKPCADRGLLPAPELAGNSNNRSHPASVTSSIAGDSPATPTIGGDHEVTDKRRKEGYGNVPKLDRTMTDVYGDELYSPNFTITSTPPSQSQQLSTISPPNDVFSQRLSAANSQHLGVRNSPISSSHDKSSPFRPISPFANATNHDFAAGNSRNAPMNSAQRVREQAKFQQDGQLFGQQMVPGNEPETPKTISPKDAILEFNEPDGSADFPLFPPNPSGLDMDMSKVMTQDPQQPFMMGSHNMAQSNQFNYLPSQLPTGIQVPQQYPFVARMHPSSDPSPPHLSSSGSSSESGANTPARHGRPAGTGADGGTYTCTYHGCTLRFETPALLQKHKREGHRQSHGLTAPRQPELVMPSNGMTSTLLNSQAGPHRCDRINPSTGKPCNTVFSRPYDLTRHEDTIHNARKQKVRCDLCTEEKTFSRADALTRHYRVCHPDMELPGKHRRRAAA